MATISSNYNGYKNMNSITNLRGVDYMTPVDEMEEGYSPYAKNFRLYAQQTDDRRVAVSTRKGPGFYINPLDEELSIENIDETGASTAECGIITGIHLQPFTAADDKRLTKIGIKLSNVGGGNAPLLISIYSDDNGKPYELLTETSIISGVSETAGYVYARFLNGPLLVTDSVYWIVLQQQEDGSGTYTLSTTTFGDMAMVSESNLADAVLVDYSINYKIYVANDAIDKGAYRLVRDNGDNKTVVVYGTTMYYVDETTDSLVPIITGLSASATKYNFTNIDNKVVWVNGYDNMTAWNGILESEASNLETNGTFESGTTNWTGELSSTISQNSTYYNSGSKSLKVTIASGNRVADSPVTFLANHKYKITTWVRTDGNATIACQVNKVGLTDASVGSMSTSASWSKFEAYYTPTVDRTTLRFYVNGYDMYIDDVSVIDTGIEYIIDTELPILSDVISHKDRLWGVTATDPNKLVFSENPGNPTDLASTLQWYHAWLSVSFIYVPRPHNGSPITAMVSFQDSLTVFTQDNKYVISGYDRGSFNRREATGNKGALSRRGVVNDENNIYFAADDGLYVHNGSSDVKLSDLVAPLFDGCGNKYNITPVIWKNQVRFYMASSGSSMNDICVVYDKTTKQMLVDTDTYINDAIYYNDADDNQELVEFSSLYPCAFYAEQGYNSLGAPIDFEYQFNYLSMGTPGQRKQIKRLKPLLQTTDSTFTIKLGMDKDFNNSPKVKDIVLESNSATWDSFNWDDGTLYGGDVAFKEYKMSYSGYANYWQPRIVHKAVNNRIGFIGIQFKYKVRKI